MLENILKLISNFNKNNKSNINCVFCLINFLIFYYRIIFSESKILVFSDVKFIEIFITITNLCEKYFLFNCLQLFKFKIDNVKYQKTILEIIYDSFIQFFLNNYNSDSCYSKLMEAYNFIFYDRNFLENIRHSIFYVNDHMKYILEKNIELNNDLDLKNKSIILKKYNTEYFANEDVFNGNMVTYFLILIFENQKKN